MVRQHATWFGPRGGTHFEAEIAAHVVCWDKDSTLAHTLHRQHMLDAIKAGAGVTWQDYSAACAGDAVIEGTATLLRLMQGHGLRHFIVSGANAEAHDHVHSWCRRHFIPYDAMALRAPGNHEPNPKFKIAVVQEIRRMMMHVDLFVEDWPDCARQIYEETGVPTLVVNPAYEVPVGGS